MFCPIRSRLSVAAAMGGHKCPGEKNMFFSKKVNKSDKESSVFSVFIREALSSDKKRVYKRVINDAIELQDRVIKKANSRRSESAG